MHTNTEVDYLRSYEIIVNVQGSPWVPHLITAWASFLKVSWFLGKHKLAAAILPWSVYCTFPFIVYFMVGSGAVIRADQHPWEPRNTDHLMNRPAQNTGYL